MPTTPVGDGDEVGALGHRERDGAVLADAVALARVRREDLADRRLAVERGRRVGAESGALEDRGRLRLVLTDDRRDGRVGARALLQVPPRAAADERGEQRRAGRSSGRGGVRRGGSAGGAVSTSTPTPRPIGRATVVPRASPVSMRVVSSSSPGDGSSSIDASTSSSSDSSSSASRSVSAGSVAVGSTIDGATAAWRASVSSSSAARVRRRSARAAAASIGRSSGSRAASARTASSISMGSQSTSSDGAGTSLLTCWNATWIGVSPVKGCRPVSIS